MLATQSYRQSFAFFFTIAAIAWPYWTRVHKCKGDELVLFISCSMAMFHGTICTLLNGYLLLTSPFVIDSPSTDLQELAVVFSITYFICDFVLLVYLGANKYTTYLAHHVLAISCLLSSDLLDQGGIWMNLMLLIGEASGPLFNTSYILRMLVDHYAVSKPERAALYKSMDKRVFPVYAVIFAILRTVGIGSAIAYTVWLVFQSWHELTIPAWARVYWPLTGLVMQAGSIPSVFSFLREAFPSSQDTNTNSEKEKTK